MSQNKKRKTKRISKFRSIKMDRLRNELSDPKRFQKHFKRLEKLLKTRDYFKDMRFSPDSLADVLDEIAEENRVKLAALDGELNQREFILSKVFRRFLTGAFINKIEKTLMEYLKEKGSKPSNLKAVAAGLFFLEFHRKQPEKAHQNPLWDLIFTISYEDVQATAGNVLRTSDEISTSAPVSNIEHERTVGSFDIPEKMQKVFRKAIAHLESGDVELGFSLETVLQGLRVHRKTTESIDPIQIIRTLRQTFSDEIGERERQDLLWGLEYAVEQSEGDRKAAFQAVYDAVLLQPANNNSVMFSLYYKCVMEFYRFLKPGETEAAKRILDSPDDPLPVLEYARFLFNQQAIRRSLKAFKAAIKLSPEYAPAHFAMGIVLWQDESFKEAKLQLHRAIRYWNEEPKKKQLCSQLLKLNDADPLPKEARALFDDIFSQTS